MHRRSLIALASALAVTVATPVLAHDFKVGPIEIKHPWARPTPPGAPTGGGYFTLVNTGTTPDRLLGGSTPAAGRLEVHEMSMDGGIMRMRKLDKGLAVPAGGTVELKPGGLHIMLIGLKAPLKVGDRVPATLRFEKAGEVKIQFQVQTPPTPGAGHDKGAH